MFLMNRWLGSDRCGLQRRLRAAAGVQCRPSSGAVPPVRRAIEPAQAWGGVGVAEATVLRYRLADLPTDPTGAPITPTEVTPRHIFCWSDRRHGGLVFVTSADDLFSLWWPGYREADYAGRKRMRFEHAIGVRTQLAASAVARADDAGTELSQPEREQLLLPVSRQVELAGVVWTSTVPLVLVEGAFSPGSGLAAPISGIDGDVREPSNILWLRPRESDDYLRSLGRAGHVELSTPSR